MKTIPQILRAPTAAVLSVFSWLAARLVQISAIFPNIIAILAALWAVCINIDGGTIATGRRLPAAELLPAEAFRYPSGAGAALGV